MTSQDQNPTPIPEGNLREFVAGRLRRHQRIKIFKRVAVALALLGAAWWCASLMTSGPSSNLAPATQQGGDPDIEAWRTLKPGTAARTAAAERVIVRYPAPSKLPIASAKDAIRTVGGARTPQSVDYVASALKHTNPDVRQCAASWLVSILPDWEKSQYAETIKNNQEKEER